VVFAEQWYSEASLLASPKDYIMSERRETSLLIWCLPILWLAFGGCGGKSDQGPNGPRGGSTTKAGVGGTTSVGGTTLAGGAAGVGGTTGDFKSCSVPADCTWTEIDVEILQAADCMCLYGCPYVFVNRTTAERRQAQWDAQCTLSHDGQGHNCGIDDCMLPPEGQCLAGVCTAPSQ
jgi:hypothetical protein